MEFGAHLPLISFDGEARTLSALEGFTETARDLGYDYLCANDHIIFQRPWLDGPTALAAVLARSGQMKLATTVAVPVFRGVAATAKILGAIDILSGGRLVVGVGPGSSARDYEVVNVPFAERWKRLEEAVGLLRALWAGEQYAGYFLSTSGAVLEPRPRLGTPGPPIWIGSWGSKVGLRRVARLADGWLASGYNTTPEQFGDALQSLRLQLEGHGRDPKSFQNGLATVWTYVTEDRDRARQVLEEVLAPMLNRPPDELQGQVLVGSPEHCEALIERYRAAGLQRLFIWPIRDEQAQLELFSRNLMPREQ